MDQYETERQAVRTSGPVEDRGTSSEDGPVEDRVKSSEDGPV